VSERRVAITGFGAFCAAGTNAPAVWDALVAARSGIGAWEGIPGLRMPVAARIAGYKPCEWLSERETDLMDPFAQFGMIAAREAVRHSGIEFTPELRENSAVITGCAVGGKTTEDDGFQELYRRDKTRLHPMVVPRTMANAAASLIATEFGLTGPSFNFATACASSNHALAHAWRMVRSGELDAVIVGGAEAPFTYGHLKAWEALRVVAPDTCRPFSSGRRGMVLGEGAGMLVLEPLERAKARGAVIHGEIVGAGMSADAHHLTQPSVEGPTRAMCQALKSAGIPPTALGYINAHGTGTMANDATETAAVRRVFACHAERLAVSSSKAVVGHTLGAAGALEAIATCMALKEGILPPNANYLGLDPDCDLDVITGEARRVEVEYAISNSFAFGGLNAVVAFRRYQ
jgi:nodulation protein E